MSWTFRLRIRFDKSSRLQVSVSEHSLPELPQIGGVLMLASPKETSIADAEWLIFKGTAPSQDDAWESGTQFADLLRRTFARMGIAAELGRDASWRLTQAGRELLSNEAASEILDNVHGLMVYPADLAAKFFEGGEARMSVGHAEWRFEQILAAAKHTPSRPTDGERAAFDLFSGYRFENSPAARLLTLTMAIEALLIPPKRSKTASALVERLIAITRTRKSLAANDRERLISSLLWLRRESITTSGTLLMKERLQGRSYGGEIMSAEQVWKEAYKLRSTLTHGRTADRAEVDRIAGLMFQVVGDLLSADLLGFEPVPPAP